MIEYLGAKISVRLGQLRELEQLLKPVKSGNLGGPGAEAVVREMFNALEQECEKLSVPVSLIQVLRERLDAGDPLAALAMSFGLLHETIEKELEKGVFFFLLPDDAVLYKAPIARFPDTIKAFPSAQNDIMSASQCYVLGQDTACVFHCMGILQYGLYALADNLGVAFDWSIELENWEPVIKNIESTIGDKRKALEKVQNKGQREEELSFYSAIAMQFRYFKDAWRNHVCHLRERYDHDQALTILTHVKDFMERLSLRVTEKIPI